MSPDGEPTQEFSTPRTRVLSNAAPTRWFTRRTVREPERRTLVEPAAPRTLVEPGAAAPRTAPLGRLDPPAAERPRWLARTRELAGRLYSRVSGGPSGELNYAVPADLRRRYRVLDRVGEGGEAVVYLAEPADAPEGSGQLVALKVYRPGNDINRELLDRLRARTAADPHTPVIRGYGQVRDAWGALVSWEAQEYFPNGSLRQLMDDGPLPEERRTAIVAAVAECLHFWQERLQHNHTDVKPANLLVRTAEPPVFALTDFGGAVRATKSRVYGGQFAITEDYAAPEIIEGRREKSAAWWSLGVIAHELATGRRPQRRENWLAARNSELDLSAIADPRWRLLARGLLTPTPETRWGYGQVREWLDGGTPEVVAARRYQPITFADIKHDDPASLAFDLLDRSDAGAVWLRSHWSLLRTWLDREVGDHTFDREYLNRLQHDPDQAQVAISALAATFVPGMPPRYRGHDISAEGVLALAGSDSAGQALLREAIGANVLSLAARHWCEHPSCRAANTNRCALLERVQHEVPLVVSQARADIERLAAAPDGPESPLRFTEHEWNRAWGLAAEATLDPQALGRARALLRAQSWHPAHRSAAPHAPWWRELRRTAVRGDESEVPARAALVAAVLTLPSAVEDGARTAKERRDAALRRRRAALAGTRSAIEDRVRDARERLNRPDDAAGGAAGDPAEAARKRAERERARVRRRMRRVEKAMTAGRCRRITRPATLLAFLDGLGGMLAASGAAPTDVGWLNTANDVMDTIGAAIAPLTALATGVLELIPFALNWWFPFVLVIALMVIGRVAGDDKRKALHRLIAARLAYVVVAVVAVRILYSGLGLVVSGVLLPLALLVGVL
ncbi:serine/threonine-protein kinase [Allonocardiopsis opalescens]|uniref:non-specific serine/threonine protein kinase n=1 Tax=Allonocardiopsis opalescens TaxID=1144618 RepID=A0A2T0Q3S0_9ACTN|nr:protein kinase [Allonocardiopsis opalescens]PRX98454.1 protein kinase-like protein [Allonocardiopsis opalescens]